MSTPTKSTSACDRNDKVLIPVDEAHSTIQGLLAPVSGVERLTLRNALGRVLAEDIASPINVPAHDNSAMDGYAYRHADLASQGDSRLKVVTTVLAGHPYANELQPGECVRIMTGAPIPRGADSVAIIEDVVQEAETAIIPAGQNAAQNVRLAGEDLAQGQTALPAGKRLRPAEIGLLASLGISEVWARRRVRVALFSTGDELKSVGKPLGPGEIYDSNRYTVWSMLSRLGCDILDMGIVPDRPEDIGRALQSAAANADVIITSGGVSAGDADFVQKLMASLGQVNFWKIAMKPGSPMAFGKLGDAWLFGLPGNPVAVMVTFYQFVRPALMQLAGIKPIEPLPSFQVRCSTRLRKSKGRTEFQRGILYQDNGLWQVKPTGAQGSGILRSMSEANCFIVLEAERGTVEAGENVTVQPLEGLI